MLAAGMQVLLDTTATNVLDLYAFQEKAAQKGDAAAEAAGSFMLFLNSDCIVDFRYASISCVHRLPCSYPELSPCWQCCSCPAQWTSIVVGGSMLGSVHLQSLNPFTQLITCTQLTTLLRCRRILQIGHKVVDSVKNIQH